MLKLSLGLLGTPDGDCNTGEIRGPSIFIFSTKEFKTGVKWKFKDNSLRF